MSGALSGTKDRAGATDADPARELPSMSTDALAADEPSGTTDAPTDDKRVLDLGDVEPASIPGATVIFAPAYTRTDDGAALRYDGDVPVAAMGVYSEIDAREALGECYGAANIDRAFAVGEWMSCEKPAHAAAAVSCVESGVATDGGAVLAGEDPATVARDTPHGETVTLVYESARSGNEVEMEVERAHVLGTTGEFRRCDDEDRPAQHRVTVGRGGTVRSHTTRSTVLGELVEVR